jgi:preprotein translocase subunit SecG
MEMEEITRLLIFVAVLVVVIAGIVFLFRGKGGEILDSIRRSLRFG